MTFDVQDPAAEKTHPIDWVEYLAAGDSIQSAGWSIEPSTGVTLTPVAFSGTVSSVKVSGLTWGQQYSLKGTITTTLGETGVQSIAIRCDFE